MKEDILYFGNTKFDGEYSNGKKWNGKIKRYNDGVLKLEGEYINGKLWNAKRYDSNHDIIYELKDGKGYMIGYLDRSEFEFEEIPVNGVKIIENLEYNDDENAYMFECEYMNGVRHGKGKEYNCKGKLLFDVEFINGKKIKGKSFFKDEDGLMKYY